MQNRKAGYGSLLESPEGWTHLWRQRIYLNALNITYMPPLHLEMFHNHNYPGILTSLVLTIHTNKWVMHPPSLSLPLFCLDPSSILFLPLLSIHGEIKINTTMETALPTHTPSLLYCLAYTEMGKRGTVFIVCVL